MRIVPHSPGVFTGFFAGGLTGSAHLQYDEGIHILMSKTRVSPKMVFGDFYSLIPIAVILSAGGMVVGKIFRGAVDS
jgi:hypothetical protein